MAIRKTFSQARGVKLTPSPERACEGAPADGGGGRHLQESRETLGGALRGVWRETPFRPSAAGPVDSGLQVALPDEGLLRAGLGRSGTG